MNRSFRIAAIACVAIIVLVAFHTQEVAATPVESQSVEGDSDGDGLTDAQETATVYFQDAGAAGLPSAIPNDGANASTSSATLAAFHGIPVRALANFSITHARKTDLTAQIGYWDGSAWIDRYVWDPGKHLLSVGITQPDPAVPRDGTVPAVATVAMPEFTSKVEFRVDGALQATVTAPVGNEYRWTWPTSGDGPRILNVTQVDTVGGQAWDQEAIQVNNLGPAVAWQYPANGASLSGPVTVWVSAPDYYGTQRVEFYLDGALQFIDSVPEPASSDYMWSWDSSSVPVGEHTLAVVAYDDLFLLRKSTASTITVTTVNDPTVSIMYPAPNAQVSGTVTVQASANSAVSSIAYVNFYLGESFRHTDDTSPYTWAWDTTQSPNGAITLKVIAVRGSDGRTATAEITVHVDNTEECPPRGCPTGPVLAAPETAEASPASMTMGVLTSDWTPGETDVGTTYTVVVDLVNPQSSASSAEMAARILRPALPLSLFMSNLQWRLVVRDWVPPAPGASEGDVTAFTLRFEAKSDPWIADTDGDGLGDGTEVNTWSTLPVTRDSDGDGLSEGYEIAPHTLTVWSGGASSIVAGFTTNPTLADTDGDGLTDGQERGLVTTGQSKVVGEVGLAVGVTDQWTKVYLKNKYTSPVVLAQPPTHRDPEAGIVRIRSVTNHTFEVRFQEWIAAGGHAAEDVSYLVVEAGNHVLPDATLVEAGTKASVGTTYVTTTFREPFAQAPIVLAQMQTYADSKAAAAKVRSVSPQSFETYLRTNPLGTHGAETVGYVAIAPQADTTVLATWTRLGVGIGSATSGTITFPKPFATTPLILSWYATEVNAADVSLRLSASSNVSFSYLRETSVAPGPEILHVFAFAQSMNLTARMTTKPTIADSDGDTLADGTEVNTHGSNPALKDTDADGIADNIEVADRTITIPVNGTARTFTFKTSPTSDDTDADGVKDPDELAGILDHRILFYDMQTRIDSARLRDLSGNGYTGTLSGPTNVTGGVKIGNSMNFDGTNDKVTATIPGLSGLTSWSFSLWFKWDNAGGSTQHLVAFGQSSDVTVYMAKANRTLLLKATDSLGAIVRHVVLATFTSTQATQPHYVAVSFDGTSLRAVVDNVAKGTWTAGAVRIRADGVKIGTSTTQTNNFYDGKIDEVQAWDRSRTDAEAHAYYNITNAATRFKARLDFETRTTAGDLFDFSGTSHTGTATGTTVVEGRVGFARRLAGGMDGVVLASSSGISISSSTGATVDILVLASAMPSQDASLVARVGSFYLNLSSDGVIRWSLHKVGTVASPLPIPLNRWVRVTATSSASSTSALTLYLDGAQVASGSATSFPSTTNTITIGYTNGQARLLATLDEFALFSSALSSWTIAGLGPAGIKLNPNGTDTDFDGLADGQELFVKSVKTPKRYPTKDQLWVSSDKIDLDLGVPAWAISRVDAMVGFTHEDMGQVNAVLNRWTGTSIDRSQILRSLSNPGEANNFTSYDLLQTSSLSSTWFSREDFTLSGRTWYLEAYDRVINKKGQIEYLQLQVTVRTWPNRADTDLDGLNDSEELNLGSDGFSTDPWKLDTDGDTLPDNEVAVKGTSPVLADTDRDGVRDEVDIAPLGDAFLTIRVDSIVPHGTDPNDGGSTLEPFVSVAVGNTTAYTAWVAVGSGGTATIAHSLSVNVPDDQATVTITIRAWDYDTIPNSNVHAAIMVDKDTSFGGCSGTDTWTFTYTLGTSVPPFTNPTACGGATYLRAEPLTVTVTTVIPPRIGTYLALPNDYSGLYNVTNSAGQTVSRRYVGEPRLVPILLNLTRSASFEKIVLLVPRSVFFDTELYARLVEKTLPAELAGALRYRENDTSASSNSDALQSILSGEVSSTIDNNTYSLLLSYLKRNTTGNLTHVLLPVDDPASGDAFFLYSLPDDALRLVGYTALPSTPSRIYTFSTGGTTVKPWWEQIWEGIVSTVTAFVISAVVFAVNAFNNLVQVLGQLGAWLAAAVGAAAQAVASAVQAAGEVLGQFIDAVVRIVNDFVQGTFSPLINSIRIAFQSWIDGLLALLYGNFRANSPVRVLGDYLAVFQTLWSYILLPLVLIATLITVAQAVEVIITVLSAGISNVLSRVVQSAAALFLLGVAAASIGAVTLAFQNGITWVFLEQLGSAADYITGFMDTQAGYFWLLQTVLLHSVVISSAAFALMSILLALIPPVFDWWVNLLIVSLSAVLAIVGLKDYLSGPDDQLSKVITPFVSTIIGVLAFSAVVNVGVEIATGILDETIVPPGSTGGG